MSYVEDVALSNSTSFAESFSTASQNTFGGTIRNFGSGTLTAKIDETTTQDSKGSAEAEAVAATAKQGSSATAALNGSDAAPASFMDKYGVWVIGGAGVLALMTFGFGTILLTRK